MTAAAPERARDLIVLADRIHTCSAHGTVEALVVRAGRVAAVGSATDLRSATPDARVIDLTGHTVTPGLTDAHAHLTEWAFARREVDLSAADSPAEAAAMVARHAAAAPSGWVRGRGWNPHAWNGATVHRAVLDDVMPDRPVVLQSHDMHALWVNSAALRRAGIEAATPDPDGGTIVRDLAGEPTGLLLEWAGRLVTDHIGPPSTADAVSAARAAQQELHTLGITGLHSFPGIHLTVPDPGTVLRRMRADDTLRLRILQHIALDELDHAIAIGMRSGGGDEWIRDGAVKMFLDGALGSRTAWMREPWEGGDGCGIRMMEPAVFRDRVRHAARHGIASTVHAIGDAAVCLALDVLADPTCRVAAMPHRIEHVQCCPPERFGDAAAGGIVCSMQPAHLITDWTIADRHWGPHRSRGAYAFGSLLRAGAILAFGSDVPVEPVDPRLGLHAAALRRDLHGAPAGGWYPAERISLADALQAYTVGAARAAGLGPPAGSLAPGAHADLAAWTADPCGDADMIMRMRCTATMVGGELVHTDM